MFREEEEGGNVKLSKLYVKLRNVESMTKEGHQKIWRVKRQFWGKVTRKSVTCEIFLDILKKFLK